MNRIRVLFTRNSAYAEPGYSRPLVFYGTLYRKSQIVEGFRYRIIMLLISIVSASKYSQNFNGFPEMTPYGALVESIPLPSLTIQYPYPAVRTVTARYLLLTIRSVTPGLALSSLADHSYSLLFFLFFYYTRLEREILTPPPFLFTLPFPFSSPPSSFLSNSPWRD